MQLKSGFNRATQEIEDQYNQKLQELRSKCVEALRTKADSFKNEGNITFFLEVKNYADLVENHQMHLIKLDRIQTPYLLDFHEKFEVAERNLEKEERAKHFQMHTVMTRHLQSLITQADQEGNSDLLSLIKAEKERIEKDDTYLLASKERKERQRQREIMESRKPEIAFTPPVSSSPPVYTKPMLEVDVSKKALAQHAEGWDYDDQIQNIRLVIKVRSREMVRDYEKLAIKVWAFGQDVNSRKNFKMLIVDTLTMDGLERGHQKEVETKTFANVFDDNLHAKFGHKFYGYLLTIEDAAGEELYRKASPSNKEGKLKHLENLSEGEEFSL